MGSEEDDRLRHGFRRKAIAAAVTPLFERIERRLKAANVGAMLWCYTRDGRDLDVVCFETDQSDPPLEVLRVLRATAAEIVRGEASAADYVEYVPPSNRREENAAELFPLSSARVSRHGTHDLVRVWSRGGYAGELVVKAGDGELMCRLMFMMVRKDGG